MLKTNSKKARQNLRAYIVENFDASAYQNLPQEPLTFGTMAKILMDDVGRVYGKTDFADFKTRLYDLPGFFDLDYIWKDSRLAKAELTKILEETPEEAERYTYAEAEDLLNKLIYSEIKQAYKARN